MTLNLDLLDNVNGEENSIIFYTEENEIENLTEDEFQLLENFDLYINGSNNKIRIKIKERKDIVNFLRKEGLYLAITGCNNFVDLGLIRYCTNPLLNNTGLQLYVGGMAEVFEDENSKNSNGCSVVIGDNTVFCGTRIYLQDDNSSVKIGKDCVFSSGIDVWCTDVCTIMDLGGNPINRGQNIEIQDHILVGKDSKIGKNTKISKDSVIGWGSVVKGVFEQSNVIIAGNPAKVVKSDINWDLRDLNSYEKQTICV